MLEMVEDFFRVRHFGPLSRKPSETQRNGGSGGIKIGIARDRVIW
jgi:hypothetical protein